MKTWTIPACPVCGKRLMRLTESCVDGHPNTHAVTVEVVPLSEVREALATTEFVDAFNAALPGTVRHSTVDTIAALLAGADAVFPSTDSEGQGQ